MDARRLAGGGVEVNDGRLGETMGQAARVAKAGGKPFFLEAFPEIYRYSGDADRLTVRDGSANVTASHWRRRVVTVARPDLNAGLSTSAQIETGSLAGARC